MNIINEMNNIRNKNLTILETEYPSYFKSINELYEISYEICNSCNFGDNFLRIIGITFTKGVVLLKSIFSLIIDGHPQEAGALLRQLIEIIELSTYFRLDEKRIDKLINNNLILPSPGERARLINGQYKDLREHLNENASHFSFSVDSCNHLIDFSNLCFKPTQIIGAKVIEANIKTFLLFQFLLCSETIITINKKVKISNETMDKMKNLKKQL